jgi:purine-nucleoside phosphorylase
MTVMATLSDAKNFVAQALNLQETPRVGLVLGSGLSAFADELKKIPGAKCVAFNAIKNFPTSTVEGHKGELISATIKNTPLIAMSGRVHAYEGYSAQSVVMPIRVLGLLGINNLVLTNAAGAIAHDFEPGQLMVISDHLNLTGSSPLVGPNLSELGPRFVDMSYAYDHELRSLTKQAAQEVAMPMHEGVYAGLLGPCYETPAEVRMLKTLGADAVGMSTVFETIAARHMSIKVLGISCLTNKAAGLSKQKITHEEVMENNQKVAHKLGEILIKIIEKL